MKAYSDPMYPREYEIEDELKEDTKLYWEVLEILKANTLPNSSKASVLRVLADDLEGL